MRRLSGAHCKTPSSAQALTCPRGAAVRAHALPARLATAVPEQRRGGQGEPLRRVSSQVQPPRAAPVASPACARGGPQRCVPCRRGLGPGHRSSLRCWHRRRSNRVISGALSLCASYVAVAGQLCNSVVAVLGRRCLLRVCDAFNRVRLRNDHRLSRRLWRRVWIHPGSGRRPCTPCACSSDAVPRSRPRGKCSRSADLGGGSVKSCLKSEGFVCVSAQKLLSLSSLRACRLCAGR